MIVTFATYNLWDYYKHKDWSRYEQIAKLIRRIRPTVLAVQELGCTHKPAGLTLRRLAEAAGMRCELSPGRYAALEGQHHNLGIGLLWQPGIEPIRSSWRVHSPRKFWHGLVSLTLDVGGAQVTHASYHGPPTVGRPFAEVVAQRQAECRLVAEELTGPGSNPFTAVGANWNILFADTLDGQPYDPPLQFRESVSYDNARAAVDPAPGEMLIRGGLYDVATTLRAPWQPTTGHWNQEKYGWRRIDGIRVSQTMLPALYSCSTIGTERVRALSDHLPFVLSYETSALIR